MLGNIELTNSTVGESKINCMEYYMDCKSMYEELKWTSKRKHIVPSSIFNIIGVGLRAIAYSRCLTLRMRSYESTLDAINALNKLGVGISNNTFNFVESMLRDVAAYKFSMDYEVDTTEVGKFVAEVRRLILKGGIITSGELNNFIISKIESGEEKWITKGQLRSKHY